MKHIFSNILENQAFDSIIDELYRIATEERLIDIKRDEHLLLFNYNQECYSSKKWNPYTKSCRGLIANLITKRFYLPLPKFQNYMEDGNTELPNGDFNIYNKFDGSLIHAFYDEYNNCWRCVTRGSFYSDQAIAAHRYLSSNGIYNLLDKNVSYLFEYCSPTNLIVVKYDVEQLILLAAYNNITFESINIADIQIPLNKADPLKDLTFNDLLHRKEVKNLEIEGWVLHWPSTDFRLKLKTDEYIRVHKLKSNITPLGVWEYLMAEMNVDAIRKDLPDEFVKEFDSIVENLETQRDKIVKEVETIYPKIHNLSRKEMAEYISCYGKSIQSCYWSYLKNKDMARKFALKIIRPTGNLLQQA